MNGSDNDLGPFDWDRIPMKRDHPDWLFALPWGVKVWNFAIEEVHEYVLRNLREIAEDYDFDGIEMDFARGVVFPAGQQWESRDRMTEFVRKLRVMLLDIERRPFAGSRLARQSASTPPWTITTPPAATATRRSKCSVGRFPTGIGRAPTASRRSTSLTLLIVQDPPSSTARRIRRWVIPRR